MPSLDELRYQLSQTNHSNWQDIWNQRPIELQALSQLLQPGEVIFHCIIGTDVQYEQTGLLVATPYRILFVFNHMGQGSHREIPYQDIQQIDRRNDLYETIFIQTPSYQAAFYASQSIEMVKTIQSVIHGTSYSNSDVTFYQNTPYEHRLFEPTGSPSYDDQYVNSAFDDFDVAKENRFYSLKQFLFGMSRFTGQIIGIAVIFLVIGIGLLALDWRPDQSANTFTAEDWEEEKIQSLSFNEYVQAMPGQKYIQTANLEKGVANIVYYNSFDELAAEKEITPSFYQNADLFQDYFSSKQHIYKILSHETMRLFTHVSGVEEVHIRLPHGDQTITFAATKEAIQEKLNLPVDNMTTKEDFKRFESRYLKLAEQEIFAKTFSNL